MEGIEPFIFYFLYLWKMNRLERISAILVKLQTGRKITAREIAAQFDISLRTVYRDIETLEEAGIPLFGNPGIGYSIVEGYRLPPLVFTTEEATAFLTAGKFIHKMTDSRNSFHFDTGLDKIRAVMRYTEKEYLEAIENNIAVVGHYKSSIDMPADSTRQILQSIRERKTLQIAYTDKEGKTSERTVEPVGCLYNNPNWHLIAWCHHSQSYRNFRIDRIISLAITEKPFTRSHPGLQTYIRKYRESDELHNITMIVKKENLTLFYEHKYPYGYEDCEDRGDSIAFHYRVFDYEHFTRWFRSVEDIACLK